jgi:hypothetical protein
MAGSKSENYLCKYNPIKHYLHKGQNILAGLRHT